MLLLFFSCSAKPEPEPVINCSDAEVAEEGALIPHPDESCLWCGVYGDGSPEVWSDAFRGMDLLSIATTNESDVYYIEGVAVADSPSRASCSIEMWASSVGGVLAAAPRDDDTSFCVALIRRTRSGIEVDTGENCHRFCGAAAAWGGRYRRLTPAEASRWNEVEW